jgi:hypothetical protein
MRIGLKLLTKKVHILILPCKVRNRSTTDHFSTATVNFSNRNSTKDGLHELVSGAHTQSTSLTNCVNLILLQRWHGKK